MITDIETNNMDIGLPVLYDGDRNIFFFDKDSIEYPAGAMIAEYARLSCQDIKQVILECNHLRDAPTDENLGLFFEDFQGKMMKRFEPIAGTMACIEIFDTVYEWQKAEKDGRGTEYLGVVKSISSFEDINEYIFSGTEYEGVGKSTVGQMLLSAYAAYATSYVNVCYSFQNLAKMCDSCTKDEADENVVELLGSLFTNMLSLQHIDFRIINVEGKFRSFYSIKNGISLLTFEFAHWLNKDVPFVKCANCGKYFVPDGRSDQIYCSYSSPQNAEKTCREIGAQISRRNKEKNDIVTREYRKVYMRYKMLTKRHPELSDARNRFDSLTEGMKGWRKKLANGSATTEQFMEWLGQF